MSKIIYDVIQRFEVENGVPRLISTNIQVIEGGEDLISLATSLLEKLGFYEKFEEKRTSQYIGYKLKNPGKGARRYQLVLTQRKEGLCISIPKDIFEPHLLLLKHWVSGVPENEQIIERLWVFPSKTHLFHCVFPDKYIDVLSNIRGLELKGTLELNTTNDVNSVSEDGKKRKISKNYRIANCFYDEVYLIAMEDQLFPYTLQVCLNSREGLKEFISYFAILIRENH